MSCCTFYWLLTHLWIHGMYTYTCVCVCVCVSMHVLWKCKMWGITSLFLKMKPFSDTKLCNKVIIWRSVANSRHQKTLTQCCSIVSQKTWIFCWQNVMKYIMLFKNNSLQLYFPCTETLAITDWHTCAIYAAICINLIMDWIPRERRKRGRPRKTWMEGVQAAMTTRNLEPDQWRNREK